MNLVVATEAAFAGDADVLVVDATGDRDRMLGRILDSTAPFVLVIAGPDLAPIERAMILAAIGPLAIELGPDRRIGALDIAIEAGETDIVAVAKFLVAAESTTGQVVAVAA